MSNDTFVGSGHMAFSANVMDDGSTVESRTKKRPVGSYLRLALERQRKSTAPYNYEMGNDLQSINSIGRPVKESTPTSSMISTIVSMGILSILAFMIGASSLQDIKQSRRHNSMNVNNQHITSYAQGMDRSGMDVLQNNSMTDPNRASIVPEELDVTFLDNSKPHILEAGSPHDQQLIFWDVAMSGSDVVEDMCHKCFHRSALKIKPKQEEKSRAIYSYLQSHIHEVDIIITHFLYELAEMLENLHKKAKVFALLRHPVDRSQAVYFKLREMGRLAPPGISFPDFVRSPLNGPHNFMVRFLVNKIRGELTQEDLDLAKAILEQKVVVGLWEDLPASIERFNKVLHLGAHVLEETHEQQTACENLLAAQGKEHQQQIFTPLEEGSEMYELLRAKNYWDMLLYDFGKELYVKQKALENNIPV